jgi:hypothetical protein
MTTNRLQVVALGVHVSVELGDELSADEMHQLHDIWTPAIGDVSKTEVFLSAGITTPKSPKSYQVSGHDFRSLASALSTQVTLAAIEERKRDLLLIHACGLADRRGRVTAFVGPSGRGKTTLASKLGKSWAYVTDETVGIDVDGRVLPYRKPLSIIESGSVPGTHKKQVSADDLSLLPLPGTDLIISAIALIDRQPDLEGPPVIRPLSLVDAIVKLVPEVSFLSELDKPLQRIAQLFVDLGGAFSVAYRDASDLLPYLKEFVDTKRQDDGVLAWSPLNTTPSLPNPLGRQQAAVYSRVQPDDGITVNHEFLMLHHGQVRLITGIGPAIWKALEVTSTLSELTVKVVHQIGVPTGDNALEKVSEALTLLVGAGVVSHGAP